MKTSVMSCAGYNADMSVGLGGPPQYSHVKWTVAMSALGVGYRIGSGQVHPTIMVKRKQNKLRNAHIGACFMGAVWAVICGRLSPCGVSPVLRFRLVLFHLPVGQCHTTSMIAIVLSSTPIKNRYPGTTRSLASQTTLQM